MSIKSGLSFVLALLMLVVPGMAFASTDNGKTQADDGITWRTSFKSDEITDETTLLMRAKTRVDDRRLSKIGDIGVEFTANAFFNTFDGSINISDSVLSTTQLLEINEAGSDVSETYATTFIARIDYNDSDTNDLPFGNTYVYATVYYTVRSDGISSDRFFRLNSSTGKYTGYYTGYTMTLLRVDNLVTEDYYNLPVYRNSGAFGYPISGTAYSIASGYSGFIQPRLVGAYMNSETNVTLSNGQYFKVAVDAYFY